MYVEIFFGEYFIWVRFMLIKIDVLYNSLFVLKYFKFFVSFWGEWKGFYEIFFEWEYLYVVMRIFIERILDFYFWRMNIIRFLDKWGGKWKIIKKVVVFN